MAESGSAPSVAAGFQGLAGGGASIFTRARVAAVVAPSPPQAAPDGFGSHGVFGGLRAESGFTAAAGGGGGARRPAGDAGTVAVILPGAFYTLREVQKPPIDLLRQNGVPMAIASDMNPGSSPMASVLLAMNMGCTLFGMTPDEVFAGTTAHAARALGLLDRGHLAVGQVADLAVWNADHPNELSYRIGFNPLYQRIIAGQI